MHHILITLGCSLALAAGPLVTAQEVPQTLDAEVAPRLDPGARSLRSSQLKPFDALWSSSNNPAGPPIHEVAKISFQGAKRLFTRTQMWPMQGGLEKHSELIIDLDDMSTRRYATWIEGLPEGAGLGGRPESMSWDFQGAAFELTTRTRGESATSEGTLPLPMFDGNGLGLALAALPLKVGYTAEIPVAMVLGLMPELTRYVVVVRVVGREKVAVSSKRSVRAWVVAVDWYDYDTRELSAKGGRSEAGGSYFILTKPSRGLPHVLRYENDTSTIEFIPED